MEKIFVPFPSMICGMNLDTFHRKVYFSQEQSGQYSVWQSGWIEAEMKEAAEIAQATEFIEEKHKNTKVRSHRAVPTYPAVKSSVFLSHVRLQKEPKSLYF